MAWNVVRTQRDSYQMASTDQYIVNGSLLSLQLLIHKTWSQIFLITLPIIYLFYLSHFIPKFDFTNVECITTVKAVVFCFVFKLLVQIYKTKVPVIEYTPDG